MNLSLNNSMLAAYVRFKKHHSTTQTIDTTSLNMPQENQPTLANMQVPNRLILLCVTYNDGSCFSTPTDILPDGEVTIKFRDGQTYEGPVVNGQMHHDGRMTKPDGTIYEVGFELGEMISEVKNAMPDRDGASANKNDVCNEPEFKEKKDPQSSPSSLNTYACEDAAQSKKIAQQTVKIADVGMAILHHNPAASEGKTTIFQCNKENNQLKSYYEGEVLNNQPHGKGKLTDYSIGQTYEGDFLNGQPDGHGKVTFFDGKHKGAQFDGQFKEGKKEGNGTYWHADGSVYKGSWKNNQYHGLGKYTSAEGWSFRGIYKEDYYNFGEKCFTNGDVYVGPFKDNQLDGEGKLTFGNGPHKGDVYVGGFCKGIRTGKGTYRWVEGNVYVGDFVDGVIQGKGTLKFFDNTKWLGTYTGEFAHGKQTKGTYEFADGNVYRGQFFDGYPNGKGTMTLTNGRVLSGMFKSGKYVGRA